MASFGEQLINLRKSRHLTQQQLADLITDSGPYKVTRSSVSMWEMGTRTPQRATLETIADIFDISISTLLNRDEALLTSPEITLIARAGQRMTQDQRELMLKWAKLTFPDAFADPDEENT